MRTAYIEGPRAILRKPLKIDWQEPKRVKLYPCEKRYFTPVKKDKPDAASANTPKKPRLCPIPEQLATIKKLLKIDGTEKPNIEKIFRLALIHCPQNPVQFTYEAARVRYPEVPLDNLDFARYMHNFQVVWNDMTFRFVVMLEHTDINESYKCGWKFVAGLQVKKDQGMSPLSPWETPWVERKEVGPKEYLLNGTTIFSPLRDQTNDRGSPFNNSDIQTTYFSDDNWEGLGWIIFKLQDKNAARTVSMLELQNDLQFIREDERQGRGSGSSTRRKRLKDLACWKHLGVGVLESLAAAKGFKRIQLYNYRHVQTRSPALYEGVFTKRTDHKGSPLYKEEQETMVRVYAHDF